MVPTELKSKYPDGLYVRLNDKRTENYEPPAQPKYVAF
jgi:hypothetical protein